MERKNFFRPCVIIPVFNEEKGLEEILSQMPRGIQPIVVDDGSSDNTPKIVSDYMHNGVILLRHEKNRGKGAALKTGSDFALRVGYDLIMTMDGDRQHSPSDLLKLIDKAKEGFHIVIGSRPYKEMPVARKLANMSSSFVLNLRTGERLRDTQSGLRAYLPHVLKNLIISDNGYMAEYETLVRAAQAGYRIAEVDVGVVYSAEIKSKIKPFQQIYRFLKFNFIDSFNDIKNLVKAKMRKRGKI